MNCTVCGQIFVACFIYFISCQEFWCPSQGKYANNKWVLGGAIINQNNNRNNKNLQWTVKLMHNVLGADEEEEDTEW